MVIEFTDFTRPTDTDDYVIMTDRGTVSYIITEYGDIKSYENGDLAIAAEFDFVIAYSRNYILDLIKKQMVDGIAIDGDTVTVSLKKGGMLTGKLDPIIIDDVPKKLPEYFS